MCVYTVLQYIWYGAEAVYNVNNKIMATHWKVYITMLKKYATELKEFIINDEPIDFLCSEIKKTISSYHYQDEASLKLSTYMMSVVVKLCSYGRLSKSHNMLIEFILFLNRYKHIVYHTIRIKGGLYNFIHIEFFFCHSYWLSDKQDAVAIKDRLLPFVDQLVQLSDDTFVKVI